MGNTTYPAKFGHIGRRQSYAGIWLPLNVSDSLTDAHGDRWLHLGKNEAKLRINCPTASDPMNMQNSIASPESSEHREQTPADDAEHQETTVLVRGENVSNQQKAVPKGSQPKDKAEAPPLNETNAVLHSHLPRLDDDADVGISKDFIVTRDGKADLAFSGSLLASAAPALAPKGEWQEYRIYVTYAGKHVFSKIGRNVNAEQPDTHEAEVFDPAPSSTTSKLLKSARDLTHSHPMTWTDAAADFFGYDPLAKELYRKLGGRFEEHIS